MSRKRKRRRGRGLPLLVCAAALIIAVWWQWPVKLSPSGDRHASGVPVASGVPLASVRVATVREPQRAVFAHSIIPGGARSGAELTRALDRDPVAAAHYRGFRGSAARLDRLEHARLAYVSYRVGNAVFWTRKPVALPAGEAVLTDGENLARTRCGNRVSFTARLPVGPDVDLDIPEVPPARKEGNDADGVADVFDLPRIVHNVFPGYFDDSFGEGPGGAGGLAARSLEYAGGLGGGAGVAGGMPLLSRDPVSGGFVKVDAAGVPRSELPAVLARYPGPVFAWTGGLTMPGSGGSGTVLATQPGPYGVTPPVYGTPITIANEDPGPISVYKGNGGIGDPFSMPPGGSGRPSGSDTPPVLVSLRLPAGKWVAPESDPPADNVPEPATGLLFASAVLVLAIRRAVR